MWFYMDLAILLRFIHVNKLHVVHSLCSFFVCMSWVMFMFVMGCVYICMEIRSRCWVCYSLILLLSFGDRVSTEPGAPWCGWLLSPQDLLVSMLAVPELQVCATSPWFPTGGWRPNQAPTLILRLHAQTASTSLTSDLPRPQQLFLIGPHHTF